MNQPRSLEQAWRRVMPLVAASVLLLGVGVAVPINRGAETSSVLLTAGAAAVVSAALSLVPDQARTPAFIVAGLVGAAVVYTVGSDLLITWATVLLLGMFVASSVSESRRLRAER